MFDHARFEVACHARVQVAGTTSEDVNTVGAVHIESPEADFSRAKHRIRSLTPIRKHRDWVRDDTPRAQLKAHSCPKGLRPLGRVGPKPGGKNISQVTRTAAKNLKADPSAPFPRQPFAPACRGQARDRLRDDSYPASSKPEGRSLPAARASRARRRAASSAAVKRRSR
jgi:hypothetical protein